MTKLSKTLAALDRAILDSATPPDDDDGSVTAKEYAAAQRPPVGMQTAWRRLSALVRIGKAEITVKRVRGVDGRLLPTTAYRLKSTVHESTR